MVKAEEILRFEENPEKTRTNQNKPEQIRKRRICEEIWLKPLKSEYLRSVLKKS